MSHRLTYQEYIKNIDTTKIRPNFTEAWFEANYKNAQSKLPFICSCGTKIEISTQVMRNKKAVNGKQCKDCINKLKSINGRTPYEVVIQTIKEKQCKPGFTKKWFKENDKGIYTELQIICKCKETYNRTYYRFKSSPFCDTCRFKGIKYKRSSFEFIINGIKDLRGKHDFNKKWFKENYRDFFTILPLLCKCKQPFNCSYKGLMTRKEAICDSCFNEKTMKERFEGMMISLSNSNASIQFDYQWFKDNYVDGKTRIAFTCGCGKEFSIQYYHTKRSKLNCMSCSLKNRRSKQEMLEAERVEDFYPL